MVQTGGDQYSSVIELRDSGEDVDIPLPKRSISGVSRFLCKWDRGIFFLLFLSCVNTFRELCLTV